MQAFTVSSQRQAGADGAVTTVTLLTKLPSPPSEPSPPSDLSGPALANGAWLWVDFKHQSRHARHADDVTQVALGNRGAALPVHRGGQCPGPQTSAYFRPLRSARCK